MNPLLNYSNLPPDYIITRRVNNDLLRSLRDVVLLLNSLGKEFSANDVMADVAAAEAAVVGAEIPTYGGFDTNVIRTWNILFGELQTFLATPYTVTYRDESTESITPETAVLRYYSPEAG